MVSPSLPGRAATWLDALILALVTGSGLYLWLAAGSVPSTKAVLRERERVLAWWPLEGRKATDTIATAYGPYVVEHGDGAVRIVSAPCVNRLCVHQGRIRHAGDHLVCLPGKLVVTVEGDGEEGFDAIQ